MEYRVNLNEISYGSLVIEADSEEDARVKASEEYHRGNVKWVDSEVKIFDIRKDC